MNVRQWRVTERERHEAERERSVQFSLDDSPGFNARELEAETGLSVDYSQDFCAT